MEYNNLDIVLEELDNTINSMDEDTSNESFEALESYLDNMMSENSFEVVTEMFEDIIVMEADTNGNGIIAKLKKAFQWLKNKFLQIVNAIWSGIKKIFNAIKNFFSKKRKTKKERIKELEDEIDKLKKENGKLSTDNENLQQKNSNIQKKLRDSENSYSSSAQKYEEKIKELEKERFKLSKELHDSDQYSEVVEIKLKNKIHELENSIKFYKNKLDASANDQEKLQDKNQELKYEKSEATTKIKNLEKKLEFLRGSDFDIKFEKAVFSELSENELYSFYLFEERLTEITRAVNGTMNSLLEYSKSNVRHFDLMENQKDFNYLNNFALTNKPSNTVNNVLHNIIKNEELLFDKNKLSSFKSLIDTFEKSTDQIKKNLQQFLSDMQKYMNSLNQEEDQKLIDACSTKIKRGNKFLSDFGTNSANIITMMNRMISSVTKVQSIYQSTLHS